MAKKYIDAEAAQADGWRIQRFISTKESSVIETRDITSLPTADVVEVRRGNPIRHYQRFCNSDGEVIREIFDGWECPFCHSAGVLNYCPNCGAKMEVDGQ